MKETLLYADDKTLINEDTNISDLEEKANHTVKTAADWFKANKLTLNAKKTRNMTILRNNSDRELNISLDGDLITNINSNSTEKFLVFRIDNKLNLNYHIKHVSNKLKAANCIIASIKNTHPILIKN